MGEGFTPAEHPLGLRDADYDSHKRMVADRIRAMEEILTPRRCDHGLWQDCDEGCDFKETRPMEGILLTDYVLVTAWTDMSGKGYGALEVETSETASTYNVRGMLHSALFD